MNEKHYCIECGKELIFSISSEHDYFDQNTGKLMRQPLYHWKCPRHIWSWIDFHTNISSFKDFKDAASQGPGMEN